jgi:hypothetical protein
MAKKYRFRIAYGEPVDQHMYMDLYDIGSVMTRHIEKNVCAYVIDREKCDVCAYVIDREKL